MTFDIQEYAHQTFVRHEPFLLTRLIVTVIEALTFSVVNAKISSSKNPESGVFRGLLCSKQLLFNFSREGLSPFRNIFENENMAFGISTETGAEIAFKPWEPP